MKNFMPNMYQKSILNINYNKLKKQGIKVIVFDLDNTIIEYDNYDLSDEIKELFKKLIKDFNVIVLSNTKEQKKISFICKELNIDYILFALKPLPFGFNKIKNKYKVNYNEMCMIGDQLFTDVRGATNLSIFACLVDPIDNNESIFTKINRKREDAKIKKLNKLYSFERGKYYD